MYNGQCAKPPDPLVKFINMILSCRTPMFILNLFQYQHLLLFMKALNSRRRSHFMGIAALTRSKDERIIASALSGVTRWWGLEV